MKWEYTYEYYNLKKGEYISWLNLWGQHGWELVYELNPPLSDRICLFKRQIP